MHHSCMCEVSLCTLQKTLSCGSVTSTHLPPGNRPYLDGGLACDVGDKEVHGDILTIDILVHHVSDGLGHHIRIQVGIILSGKKGLEYS